MNTTIKLSGVRLSFPNLFTPTAFEEGKPKSYSATFILDKETDTKQIADIQKVVDYLCKSELKKNKLPADKVCLRDGDMKEDVDGYGDAIMFVSSGSKNRPTVVDRQANDITNEGDIYAGCYVNASIRLWAQDNQYGKRINADLRGIQFLRDGDPFGGDKFDAKEEFGVVGDDQETFDFD
tara:strand:+ start:1370 stop:1909 length:540 start_codon:yes stop_codon:yes gene_type:complete